MLDRWRALSGSVDRVLLAAALITVVPLWSAHYLPFTDLPEHLAVIATLRHWTDPAWNAGATYTLALGKSQYLGYHVLGAMFAVPFGVELGNRILLTLIGIAFPYAVRALLRAFGTEECLAVLACPLFWSRPLVIGFLPYVSAIPVVLYALALLVRQRCAPTRRRALAICALAVAAFYLHVSAYAVLVAVAFALALVPRAGSGVARALLDTALVFAPSLACVAVWSMHADPRGGPMLLAGDRAWAGPPRTVLAGLFAAWTHDVWTSHVDEVEGVAFWLLVLWVGSQRSAQEPEGARAVATRLVPFACVLLMFVALPYRLGAGAMLNVRLAPLIACFVLPVLRPDPGPRTRAAAHAGALLAVAVAVTAVVEIRRSQREIGDLDALLARIRPGARVLTLHFEHDSTVVQAPAWIHIGSYHRLRRGGVASLSFSEMAHWPIQYRAEARPPEKEEEAFWDFKPCLFRNSVDGAYFDYVLSNGSVDPFAGTPPGPTWRRIATAASWRLDEKVPGSWNDGAGAPDRGPCPAH